MEDYLDNNDDPEFRENQGDDEGEDSEGDTDEGYAGWKRCNTSTYPVKVKKDGVNDLLLKKARNLIPRLRNKLLLATGIPADKVIDKGDIPKLSQAWFNSGILRALLTRINAGLALEKRLDGNDFFKFLRVELYLN